MAVSHIPEGYHSVTPYLIVDGAEAAIPFYAGAFGAEKAMTMPMGDSGKLAHAEIRIDGSHVMLADEFPEMGFLGPLKRGGATASLMIYVADVDSAFARALAAGAKQERAPEDQFWGDRMGTLVDPFGHRWTLATHVEDVSDEEIRRRAAAAFEAPCPPPPEPA